MKKILLNFLLLLPLVALAQVTTNPSPIIVDQSLTITVDINSTETDCNGISNPTKVYAHLGVGNDSDEYGIAVVGNWGQDDGIGEMTNNGDGTWSITFTPNTYFSLTSAEESTVTKMGMVFRNADGTQELKATGCTNFIFNIGAFQVNMINPSPSGNGIIVVDSGANTQILAQNTGGPANYELFANGSSVHTQNNTTFYNGYLFSSLTENQFCELVITQGASTITKQFTIIVNNTTPTAMPANMEDGINYNPNDPTKATLVIDAPNKDFVYVAGSFNNWTPTSSYAMKKDTATSKFWLELTGLTSGEIETYQYWVGAISPVTNSPKLVKTADPYSTLVLSPFDDPYISASTYPNLPDYPSGQEREVTVLQTGQTPYNWQVTNFEKPKKEDLIIYEVLIRDFDQDRNFQDLIDKIDYFKNLNINAIELMPIMEYEGNESWGYNTSFHMALDKFYGTEEKFKEFVDLCHQNDIAVILDLALNHAFGRNPMNRMWMDDPDGDGWGEPSSENPYFNQVATHSYSVGSDFNHQQSRTQYYTERVVQHWIEEFKIDGFRWDLTKGFTQNCASSDDGCTNGYQQDRVDILKQYADFSWSVDPTHYVIFEHLGQDNEEKEWANYRLDEGKGVMMWGIMNSVYNELTMGQSGNKNISRMGHTAHSGFNGPRVVGYAESHDEERLMYKNLQYGNNSNSSHDVRDLNTALSRMSALGAVSVMIPGPKMIWHFGELGMENSIFTCFNGTYNNDGCKLDTKPQPQWTNNWITDALRSEIYNDWSRLHALKINEPVFEGDYSITSGDFTPRIDIFDTTIPSTELRNVIILANFDVVSQTVNTNFPSGVTATWYDLMDPSGNTTVSNSTTTITIPAGQFRILGNKQAEALSIDEEILLGFSIYPNPATTSFHVSTNVSDIEIYDLTGKLVKSYKGEFNRTDSFDISQLNTGMYIVKVENNNNQIKTTKLVKL
ncbi:T9SS type A sorting domain-containing protein [Winogradskyella psychrotolerans]|uniref:alpha-amylase family glycosyl hydrolase n=1 Tax=Winogradskyella psychrotolerans TaxID=1344585 RepID=UPI001C079BDC|nr:alpha-amylase family glycosyl hydrolase [Winogradskyella psychrotolerans]MBU2922005.1 T9SS type A sorting domain-containing protein [Winogradskyella psychrotolerans]